ncbi:MAG TPA: M14 family metallocarboxypeptidase [Rubrivivax sp.]|nr:M14 family metallocarboxypeptidase [Rubrivivax sp.]
MSRHPDRRRWLAFATAALCTVAAAAGAAPEPGTAAVAARFAAPATRYDTPGLQPGRSSYTSNDEMRAALHALAAGPQGPRLLAAGRSQLGVAIEALHYTRGAGRPAVLLVGQQHGDEPAGAEALLAVARLLTAPEWAPLLDRIDVVVLPRANPDGAALGLRWGQHGLDINRDHLLLRSPEAQALALLVRAYRPLVVVDAHEYPVLGSYRERFNAVQRSDLLFQYATVANLPAELSRVSETVFRQPLWQALAGEGLRVDWYHTSSSIPGDRRLAMGDVQPGTMRNAQGLMNAVGILLESRGVGIGRAHLDRRVHSHVVAVRSLLHSAAAQAGALQALQRYLDAQVAGDACRGEIDVLVAQTPTRRDMLMLDPVTGADKPVAVHWESSLEPMSLIRRARPCGYWLAAEAHDAVQRLRALGVVVRQVTAAGELLAETWREISRTSVVRPDARGGVDDGLGQRVVQVRTEAVSLPIPAGSWWVPLDQPLANLVVAALEPDTPGSWFAQRVLPGLESAARVMTVPEVASPPGPADERNEAPVTTRSMPARARPSRRRSPSR